MSAYKDTIDFYKMADGTAMFGSTITCTASSKEPTPTAEGLRAAAKVLEERAFKLDEPKFTTGQLKFINGDYDNISSDYVALSRDGTRGWYFTKDSWSAKTDVDQALKNAEAVGWDTNGKTKAIINTSHGRIPVIVSMGMVHINFSEL